MRIPEIFGRAETFRKSVQAGFLVTVCWIGLDFARFVGQLEYRIAPSTPRPPGVEAFLPISSLISLKHWILTGNVNSVHPAGLFIFIMVLCTALLLKKGFCSWVCPIGLFSESLAWVHRRLFRRPVTLPAWLDFPLRSLKYLLLIFFLWAIVVKMDTRALETFIYSPYNRVADIKMLKFFTQISTVSLVTLVLLTLLSLFVRHFWCRYLCPYGALLGALSLFSVTRIRRDESACIQCEKCTRACPSSIRVHRAGSVGSDECHACMKCVDACPVPGTLELSLAGGRGTVKPWVYALAMVLIFSGGTTLAKKAGLWQNGISAGEYIFHMHHLSLPVYQHNRGSVPAYDGNIFPRPERFPSETFRKGEQAYHGPHRYPDPRASGDPESPGRFLGG